MGAVMVRCPETGRDISTGIVTDRKSFEAYVPREKRLFGYFALPVLVGDDIVALLDLKADREQQKLLLQRWTWLGKSSRRSHRKRIEDALHRFERFQLAR